MKRQVIYCVFISIFTLFIAIKNVMYQFRGEKVNLIHFLILLIYLLCWYQFLKKSNDKLLKFSITFWGMLLFFTILEIPWVLYDVHFPLFSPFIIAIDGIFWGITILHSSYLFLLLIKGIVVLVYLFISIKYFKKYAAFSK